jgi:hypothetical protein
MLFECTLSTLGIGLVFLKIGREEITSTRYFLKNSGRYSILLPLTG